MTEIHIPYLPSAKFFKVLCRLGVHEQDISSDTDSNPQIRTIGGTVTISASIGRFRYTEADGRSRVIYNKTETYNIQTSTGELFDVDGNLGVNLLDTTSPGIDPQGWTYKATVRPTGGEPFDVNIPASLEPGDTLDLGDGLVFTPSTGVTSLETRVKALEDAGPSGGGPTAWNDITDKPTSFAPSEHRHDASEIDNLPSGSGGSTAWDDIANKPAVIAAGATAAAARDAIGAGTSDLELGTTPDTAAAGDRQATTSAIGMVELATTAEATTGTDTTRAVTPAGLKAVADTKAASSHSHTASQVTDFTKATQDIIGAMVTGAGGTYNDAAGTIILPSGGGSDPWTYYVASAETTNNTTTRVNAAGLSIPSGLTAGTYLIDAFVVSKLSADGGHNYSLTKPTGGDLTTLGRSSRGAWEVGQHASSAAGGSITVGQNAHPNATWGGPGAEFKATLYVASGATSTAMNITFAPATAGTVMTIMRGSYIAIRRIA